MEWRTDHLRMLDQRRIPLATEYLILRNSSEVAEAILDMAVRGAPAIGIAGAYGMALAALYQEDLDEAANRLRNARPTAVNLGWAIDRVMATDRRFESILAEAQRIDAEDLELNLAIGRHGSDLIKPGFRILTICNTGALATAGHGTALGVIRTAHADGKAIHVYSCETRPRQQGLRLTAYELTVEGIPFHSIADSAAGTLMQQGRVDLVIAGADRIAANGDSANKIGTYSLAVLAHYHDIPFYIAAPYSTFDPKMPDGSGIPIEERDPRELTEIEGVRVAPEGTPVYNPGFDVTPGRLITGIITERGVFSPPYDFS